jgi:hypothetical protein
MPMALLILTALFVPLVLGSLGWLPWGIVVIAEFAILFLAAMGIDRNRSLGARDPFLDANRAEFPISMTDTEPQVPVEAVQSPSDRRSPE